MVASHVPPAGDHNCNPGMYPDWELNQGLFVSQAGAQSTELHQPGQKCQVFKDKEKILKEARDKQ